MSPAFSIGGVSIGEGAPVFIVAELSANHGGDLSRALRTIEEAAKVGANAIKIQTYTPDTLTLKSDAPPFVVRTKNEWAGRTLHDLYAEAMTPWEWHAELKKTAEALGLIFFSTPFDPTAVEYLEALDVPVHKIASFELVDLPLIEHVARRGRPMIMSTGMASLGEIEAAVAACRSAGNYQIALLRCVSAYPAQPSAMNLQSIAALRAFGTVVGLSDHTRDATVALSAVALGAKIIEKHFILDRALGGPDAFFSLEPAEFRSMVDAVRAAESALGPPRFGASEDERASLAFRRSLFVARDVAVGQVLTCDDVRSVRPSSGLEPRHLPAVLGRTAARAMVAGTPLLWQSVGQSAVLPALELKPATRDDAPALREWRNDKTTRAMSVHTHAITVDEHAAWLARTLEAGDRTLLVGWSAGVPIGQVRLDRGLHGRSEISVTVAPAARGKGLATALLVAAEEHARREGGVLLVARIRAANLASVRAFKDAGYYAFIERTVDDEPYLFCERRIVPYSS